MPSLGVVFNCDFIFAGGLYLNLQLVMRTDGVEYRLDVVIPVTAFVQHIQPDIDFGR